MIMIDTSQIYLLTIEDKEKMTTEYVTSTSKSKLWDLILDDVEIYVEDFKKENCDWYEEFEGLKCNHLKYTISHTEFI